MPRHANRILLHLLLLLVSLSPLRGFAMPQTSAAMMSGCEQMQHAVTMHQAQEREIQTVCAFCKAPGCEDGQCNMALCGAFHTPVSFLTVVGIASAQGVAIAPPARPGEILPDRSEPPLIRPPIALHG